MDSAEPADMNLSSPTKSRPKLAANTTSTDSGNGRVKPTRRPSAAPTVSSDTSSSASSPAKPPKAPSSPRKSRACGSGSTSASTADTATADTATAATVRKLEKQASLLEIVRNHDGAAGKTHKCSGSPRKAVAQTRRSARNLFAETRTTPQPPEFDAWEPIFCHDEAQKGPSEAPPCVTPRRGGLFQRQGSRSHLTQSIRDLCSFDSPKKSAATNNAGPKLFLKPPLASKASPHSSSATTMSFSPRRVSKYYAGQESAAKSPNKGTGSSSPSRIQLLQGAKVQSCRALFLSPKKDRRQRYANLDEKSDMLVGIVWDDNDASHSHTNESLTEGGVDHNASIEFDHSEVENE